MKVLYLFILIHGALAQSDFGRPYMRNSRLCHQWDCLNTKLGLSASLPLKENYIQILNGLLPQAAWMEIIPDVIETCYHNRSRNYANTCAGQALLHCTVDQLMEKCPAEWVRKNDSCASLNSLAGTKLMFTQSRYLNSAEGMPHDKRSGAFLRRYYNKTCCNLPPFINSSVLTECSFNPFMVGYFDYQIPANPTGPYQNTQTTDAKLNVVHLNAAIPNESTTESMEIAELEPVDPLDCCDMSELVQTSWRQECGFKTSWRGSQRLEIEREAELEEVAEVTTEGLSTTAQTAHQDIVVVPHSCEKSTCIFNKLSIITNEGSQGHINKDLYTRFLDNLTNSSPDWTSAKARVVTTCLTRPLVEYTAECEINTLLACTFDLLTENCPYTKNDSCKHSYGGNKSCQISSSKYRPKNRREICNLPELQNDLLVRLLGECGINSFSNVQKVTPIAIGRTRPEKQYWYLKSKCQDLTTSISCLLNKMGTLSKYGFIDYYKMKDRLQNFSKIEQFSTFKEVYMSAYNNMPLYTEHCNSARKFLNVVDSILMTCPISRRKNTKECNNFFATMHTTPNTNNVIAQGHLANILQHYFIIYPPHNKTFYQRPTPKTDKKPIYNYGLLNTGDAPTVQLIDLKPKVEKKPLVIIPVYMRISTPHINFVPYSDPTLRSGINMGFSRGISTKTNANNIEDSTKNNIPAKVDSTTHTPIFATANPIIIDGSAVNVDVLRDFKELE